MPIVGIVLVLIVISFFRGDNDDETIPFSEVVAMARAGNVDEIEVHDRKLTVTLSDGREYESRRDRTVDLVETLERNDVALGGTGGVEVEFRGYSSLGGLFPFIIAYLPPIAVVFAIYFIVRNAVREGMRQGRSSAGNGADASPPS